MFKGTLPDSSFIYSLSLFKVGKMGVEIPNWLPLVTSLVVMVINPSDPSHTQHPPTLPPELSYDYKAALFAKSIRTRLECEYSYTSFFFFPVSPKCFYCIHVT